MLIARELHCTVTEAKDRLTITEFWDWLALREIEKGGSSKRRSPEEMGQDIENYFRALKKRQEKHGQKKVYRGPGRIAHSSHQ